MASRRRSRSTPDIFVDIAICPLQVLDDDRVLLGVHVLPWSFRKHVLAAISLYWPASGCATSDAMARLAVDHVAIKRTRDLLESLDWLTMTMACYDRTRRAQTRLLGRPTSLAGVAHPLLAHDACTMYASLALAVLATPDHRHTALSCIARRFLPPAALFAQWAGL